MESSVASTDTDSDGKTTAQVTKVTTDGKELDVDNFKTFYQYLMGCPTNEIYFTDPEGESYLTITFDRKDGKKDVMEIYKDSSRRSLQIWTDFLKARLWTITIKTHIPC